MFEFHMFILLLSKHTFTSGAHHFNWKPVQPVPLPFYDHISLFFTSTYPVLRSTYIL